MQDRLLAHGAWKRDHVLAGIYWNCNGSGAKTDRPFSAACQGSCSDLMLDFVSVIGPRCHMKLERYLLAIVVAILLGGVGCRRPDTAQIENAARRYYEQFRRGEYRQMYSEYERVRMSGKLDEWLERCNALTRDGGAVVAVGKPEIDVRFRALGMLTGRYEYEVSTPVQLERRRRVGKSSWVFRQGQPLLFFDTLTETGK